MTHAEAVVMLDESVRNLSELAQPIHEGLEIMMASSKAPDRTKFLEIARVVRDAVTIYAAGVHTAVRELERLAENEGKH